MSAIITSILALLQTIIPSIGSASAIGKIVLTLTEIIPVITKEVKDLIPIVKNIIAALKSNEAISKEQIDQLQVLDAQCDEAFEEAATKAEADDKG